MASVTQFTITAASGNYPAGGVVGGVNKTAAQVTAAQALGDTSAIANCFIGSGMETIGVYYPFRTIHASGTFGGGSLKIQFSEDNGVTWTDVNGYTALTATGKWNILERWSLMRLVWSGATSPSVLVVII